MGELDEIINLHDCLKCPRHGTCELEGVIEWQLVHKDELLEFDKKVGDMRKTIIQLALGSEPILILCLGTLDKVITQATWFGYCKGRMYVDVPEAFKK